MIVDTHCHLDFPAFDPDRGTVIERARAAGVEAMVVPAVTVDNFQRVLSLCGSEPGLYPALGLHPCFSHRLPADLERLEQALTEAGGQVVALGEIGLDLRPGQAALELQLELLQAQLELAKVRELPVLLHVVKAHDQVLKCLRRLRLPRAGIVHAFSGSEQQAREYLKLGFRLGFGGAVTYDRAQRLRRLATLLPLESLVLETDAPDMPPSGHAGTRNEPAASAQVARLLAELRGVPLAEVTRVTTATALSLLGLY